MQRNVSIARLTLMTLILAVNIFNSVKAENTTCTACRCYKIKCSRIENADIDCEDDYKDTCDHSSDIVEENDCNVQCDCCLEGQCYTWDTYYCVMFRTFEFFSVAYFLAISANFFVLWHLYKSFFRLKRPYDKTNFSDVSNANRNYYKYVQKLWIRRYKEVSKTVIPDKKSRDVAGLFSQIEKIKPIAFKNLIFFLIVVSLYLVLSGINLFILFFLMEKPLFYGVVAWVQHGLHCFFYLLSFVVGVRIKSYRKSLNDIIDAFETDNHCELRIINKLHLFEINWAPKLTETNSSESKKITKLLKTDKISIEEIDSEVIRIKKLDIKEGKAKKFTAKVAPI